MHTIKQRPTGFTLYELVTALAVFAVLTVVGVPGYLGYVRNSQLSNMATTLYTDLLYARSEALKRKIDVVVCRSADPTLATPTCGGTAKNWATGWLIFADIGGAAGVYNAGTDKLLRIGQAAPTTVTIISNNNADARLAFSSDGTLGTVYVTSAFAICDDRDQNGSYDAQYGRQVDVSAIGRPQITTGNIASCTNPT